MIGKCFDGSCRNVFHILVLKCFDYGELNHIMFRFLKKTSSFVNFDVENFYPSISIDLFTDAINYASYKNTIKISYSLQIISAQFYPFIKKIS